MTDEKPENDQQENRNAGASSSGTPALSPPKDATGRQAKSSRGGWLGLLAILLCIALGVGGYYLWTLLQQTRQALEALHDSDSAESAELSTLRGRLNATQAEGERLSQRLGQLDDIPARFDNLTQENAQLRHDLGEMQARLSDDPHKWALAEAEYLLRLANHRLILARDPVTAATALEAADQILMKMADPALQGVRQAIAGEIAALRTVALPDVPGLAARIGAIIPQLANLPVKARERGEQPPAQAQVAEVSGEAPAWKGYLLKVWEELKSLVVIRREDKAVAPLLPPQEQTYLQYNLMLKLEGARLALIQGDAQTWRQSLQDAHDWLHEFHDPDAPAVRAVLTMIEEIRNSEVSPPLPDISGSLRLLQQRQARPRTSTPVKPQSSLGRTAGQERVI